MYPEELQQLGQFAGKLSRDRTVRRFRDSDISDENIRRKKQRIDDR